MATTDAPHRYILMGVMGSGKTSVGEAMAARGGLRYLDGDSLHPAENIAKMSAGIPLTDTDRGPWLADVGRALHAAEGALVIGCSALRRRYRDLIRQEAGHPVRFLHLHADRTVLAERTKTRDGHFMPPALLESQLATLEPLEADEDGQQIDIDQPLDQVVSAALALL